MEIPGYNPESEKDQKLAEEIEREVHGDPTEDLPYASEVEREVYGDPKELEKELPPEKS
ncbi:MAG TPA: hypothetical protein VNA68_02520 [Candidatus Dormibacteraeota bacterium]|nr:hypothetical protein [Candidatus Dormibacteraeota bacterium]